MSLASTPNPPSEPLPKLTTTQWLIVIIAAIGFCFDIYELLMLPLIFRDAAEALANIKPADPEFKVWLGWMFFLPAFVGGFFGLIGGYLTDLFGRRRMLVFSILLYAFSAFFAAFSTSLTMLLVLRCTTFIGICLEFVAAVAWLAELFPHPRQREIVLGWTQAFSSLGGLAVAGAFYICVQSAASLPAIAMPGFLVGTLGNIDPASAHAPWRYTLMSGLIPAIPLIVIRPFLPESPLWRGKKEAGTLRRPSYAELFRPAFRRTTIVTTLMIACSYGAAFGAIQQMPQILTGVPEVQEETAGKPVPAAKKIEGEKRSQLQMTQEIGGLTGRCLLAILVVYIVSRRGVIRAFLVPGFILLPLVFAWVPFQGIGLFYVGLFLAGLLTVGQFSFWGNYLPRVYPVWLRGTGGGFTANVGGRILGTSFAVVATLFAGMYDTAGVESGPEQFAYAAATVCVIVYGVSLLLSFFLPEPRSEEELNQ